MCMMDPIRLKKELGVVPRVVVHGSAKALDAAWNEREAIALDWIRPMYSPYVLGFRKALVYRGTLGDEAV